MAKPICIIKASREAMSGHRIQYSGLQELFEKRLPDYHVFVILAIDDPSEPQEYFTFQVFYEKDFTEIEYGELKEIINRSLN